MAISSRPKLLRPELKTALKLAKARRLDEASRMYADLYKAKPNNVAVLDAFITFQNRFVRKPRTAVPMVVKLLKSHPNSARSHRLATETFANLERYSVAVSHAETLLKLDGTNPKNCFVATHALMGVGQFDRAIDLMDVVLKRRPNDQLGLLQKARALHALGRLKDAQALCETLLEINPSDINALRLYTFVADITVNDPVLNRLLSEILPAAEKKKDRFLTDVLEMIGAAKLKAKDHSGAFEYFERAKTSEGSLHDAKAATTFVSQLSAALSQKDFKTSSGIPSTAPTLIVGMPRSGSTLLEKVIASHPKVSTIGEGTALRFLVRDLGIERYSYGPMIRAVREMPDEGAVKLAERYIIETQMIAGKNEIVVDKGLHNFELLGVFSRLLPNARIIHTLRDPLDTCISCYLQRLSRWHSYTRDLADLGQAYLDHLRLMRHWEQVLPNPIHRVVYEDLIQNQEKSAKSVIAFLGLDWDEVCLPSNATQQETAVRTLSAGQVSKQVYTTSMQRWRRHEDRLEPLMKVLEPLYPNGFDAPAVFNR